MLNSKIISITMGQIKVLTPISSQMESDEFIMEWVVQD